jgi:hypothetical protein
MSMCCTCIARARVQLLRSFMCKVLRVHPCASAAFIHAHAVLVSVQLRDVIVMVRRTTFQEQCMCVFVPG